MLHHTSVYEKGLQKGRKILYGRRSCCIHICVGVWSYCIAFVQARTWGTLNMPVVVVTGEAWKDLLIYDLNSMAKGG